jgi:hypothetical protein
VSVRFDGRDISEREFRTDWRGSRVLRAIVAVAFALALLAFGVGIASASAMPGDRLWPAAKLIEDARLALAGEDRAAVHAEFANARLDDMLAALAAGDVERAGLAAAEFSRHTALAASGGATPVLDAEYQARVLAMLYRGVCEDSVHPGCAAVAAAWHTAGGAYELEADADRDARTSPASGKGAPTTPAGRPTPAGDDDASAGDRPAQPSGNPDEPPAGPPPAKPAEPRKDPPPAKPADPPAESADPPKGPPAESADPPKAPPADPPRATPAEPPAQPPAGPGDNADPADPNHPPQRDEAAQSGARGSSDD